MCITFFHLDPVAPRGKYKLILVMNRDESVTRATQQCQWKDNILAGRDLTSGKEGGTWLAMDRRGRVGFLTNVTTGTPLKEGLGRGHLVIDFLKSSPDKSALDYLTCLDKNKGIYNPFNLLFMDVTGSNPTAYYVRGMQGHIIKTQAPTVLTEKDVGLSNSPMDKPFLKTKVGKELFVSIVERLNASEREPELIEALIKLMSNQVKHGPDSQMELQGGQSAHTSIFVDAPSQYRTIMQSVILIDAYNKAIFLERTRTDKLDGLGEWTEVRHCFDLEIDEKKKTEHEC